MAFELVVLGPKVPGHLKRWVLVCAIGITVLLVEEHLVHCESGFTLGRETVGASAMLEAMNIFLYVLFGVILSDEGRIRRHQRHVDSVAAVLGPVK